MNDVVDYIYDFLFDPERDRWEESRILYLLDRAADDISSKVALYLQNREVKRQTSILASLATKEETVSIPLEENVNIYKLPDDFLRVVSVSYEGCFIRQVFSCDLADTSDECNLDIRGWNVSAVARGQILVLPTPVSTKVITKETTASEVEATAGYASFGWGLLHGVSQQVCREDIVMSLEENVNLSLDLCDLQVVYETKDIPTFADNDDEIYAKLLADKQLLKYYVCGQLLRDDRDSNSRSLGNEELQLFNDRVITILSSFDDVYVTDSILQLQANAEGNVDTDIVGKVDQADLAETDREITKMKLQEDLEVLEERKDRPRFGALTPSPV